MSLAAKVTASRKAAKQEAEDVKKRQAFDNRYIAKTLALAKKNKREAFPTDEIQSLTELAYRVVAENFSMYPELKGVEDEEIKREIVKLT
jgi:hypothetical protein